MRWIDEVLEIALQYQPVPREPILIDLTEVSKIESPKKFIASNGTLKTLQAIEFKVCNGFYCLTQIVRHCYKYPRFK